MSVANTLSAVNAYRNQLKMMQDAKDAPDGQDQAAGSSFADLVKGAINESIDTQYNTEAMKMDALTTGKVDLSDLVTAVSNAELTLNTVVAVRDRVISAYQDILRMPI